MRKLWGEGTEQEGEGEDIRRPKVGQRRAQGHPRTRKPRGRGFRSGLRGRSVTLLWNPRSDVGVELPLILMHPKPSHGEGPGGTDRNGGPDCGDQAVLISGIPDWLCG